jgi:DNA-binding response OmpR family regulator
VEKNIYVLMLNSVSEENELYRAFDAGVDDYSVKPLKTRALAEAILRSNQNEEFKKK